ncbi:polyprenyl synthetase [Leptospira inadai serovar Lyme str. 10]|uniref:Polyprenyl synthetase n=2 Tax=Leptospira inadai serovar Lyme TaxID=293084 RepID=V6HCW8_9LEPT|nr:polyprenyl synthetase family protein [Leptospira inadai]EQA37577.1 polyprenyl synthetase [Leptospira inadai serovar Lyme str. 10]PNV75097.1 geranylgeranyl pyrophosphate synthase [Leptospira inadai serovar Lyme]
MKAKGLKDLLVRKFDKKLYEIIDEDLRLLAEIKDYTIRSGGKRIRPVLHYCMCRILGYKGEKYTDVGAIAELIHAASLLHDDVVDEAQTRRGVPSVGSKFGNKTAILAGDYLLACGIDHLNSLGSPSLMDLFTQVIKDLSISELIQMEWERNPKLDLGIYDRVVYGKTASLFGAVCQAAGILAETPKKNLKKLHEFGIRLGSLFQKQDDAIDYFQAGEQTGKIPLKDFKNGLYTYPVLKLLEYSDKNDKKLTHSLFAKEDRTSQDEMVILSLLNRYNIRKTLNEEFQADVEELLRFLKGYPETPEGALVKEQFRKLTPV